MAAREVNPVIFFNGHKPSHGRVVNPETYVFGVDREEVDNKVMVPVHPSGLGDLAGTAETGRKVVVAEETNVSGAIPAPVAADEVTTVPGAPTTAPVVPAESPLPPAGPSRPVPTTPATTTVPKDQPVTEK
jgi:hypothetical protein